MKKVLIVVDMQTDFATGSLGTLEAVSILDKDGIRTVNRGTVQS